MLRVTTSSRGSARFGPPRHLVAPSPYKIGRMQQPETPVSKLGQVWLYYLKNGVSF